MNRENVRGEDRKGEMERSLFFGDNMIRFVLGGESR